MGYSIYLFDFDYTLANAEVGIITCYRYVLERHGFTGISDYDICRTIGHPITDSLAMLSGEDDKIVLEQFREEFKQKSSEVMVNSTVLYPSTIPVLQKLKERGYKTGIISTKYRIRIMGTLERYNIVNLVDLVIGGEDVSCPKPDPQGIDIAAEYFNASKSNILFIGDSLIDANAAKNARVDFAAVTTGTTTPLEFEGLPYIRMMKDLEELLM